MKHIAVLNENANTYMKNSNVHSVPMTSMRIDVEALEQELRTKVSGEVRFDEGSRALIIALVGIVSAVVAASTLVWKLMQKTHVKE
ncbi:MAG: hypothetical protein NVS4B11_26340 [Ktedonobacteraceae bacterium]